MKMERFGLCACVLLAFSVLLHGCDFGEDTQDVEKDVEKDVEDVERVLKPKPPPKPLKKGSAKCNGGHFKCDGEWREWCARMEKKCKKKDCAPLCTWTCDSPRCSQECGPVCNQPHCSTRCKGFNTDSCKMKCGKPMCKVVCPKHSCPSEDCAACKTVCGKPACKMECGNDVQPCRHVCAQPVCKWECKNPQLCPKPKCEMKCKKNPGCERSSHMFQSVPPLEPGETEVVTMDAGSSPAPSPASFLQSKDSTLRVNFTRMDPDHTLHTGQVNLALAQTDSMDDATTWTREVSEHFGHVTESEAYCTDGKFRCRGDVSWCSEQEKIVCSRVINSEETRASRGVGLQSHLQP